MDPTTPSPHLSPPTEGIDAAHADVLARLERAEAAAGLGSWELDLANGTVWWSRQMCVLAGSRPGEPAATDLRHLHPDDRQAAADTLSRAVVQRQPQQIEVRSNPKRGPVRWWRASGQAVFGPDGQALRLTGTLLDITAVKQAQLDLQALNTALTQQVAERTQDLETSLQHLTRANGELAAFTAAVSHDLKAPLRALSGYSRMLLRDHAPALDDEGRGFVGAIHQAAGQMSRLIDDLLAYARLETGPVPLGPVDLALAVRHALTSVDDLILARGVQLQLDLPPLVVKADARSLGMVLGHLLDNALKFSRHVPQPSLRLRAACENGRVRLSVTDNGIGFDMSLHNRIFQTFQRLQRVEDYPGTGLGLATVRKAMDRMGGRCWADSQPGQGATFHIEFAPWP